MDNGLLVLLVGYLVAISVVGLVLVELRSIRTELRYANWLAHERLTPLDHPGLEITKPPAD